MILCETVFGSINDERFQAMKADYVEIEWYESFKRIHQKTTRQGREMGIRLGTDILMKGLREGDILWQEGQELIAVQIPPCEVIVIDIDNGHPEMAYKVCYEIGNKHAALMKGDKELQFITPYNEPTLQFLKKLHGVQVRKEVRKLDFDRAVSSTVSSHAH